MVFRDMYIMCHNIAFMKFIRYIFRFPISKTFGTDVNAPFFSLFSNYIELQFFHYFYDKTSINTVLYLFIVHIHPHTKIYKCMHENQRLCS